MVLIKKPHLSSAAFPLGEGHPLEAALTARGLLRRRPDGDYEVFTREVSGGAGELARPGDYVKLDTGGYPYPNRREDFLAGHRRLEGDRYVQDPVPLPAWQDGQPLTEEMAWALDRGLIRLDPADPERYFSAFRWGAHLTAPRDAAAVFYRVERDGAGAITGLEFNFVVRQELEATYDIVQ